MQEEELLIVSLPFHDLRGLSETRAIAKNAEHIHAFLRIQPQSRFVMLLQTHADPSNGALHFAPGKSTDLHEVNLVYNPY